MRGWRKEHRNLAANYKDVIVMEWGYFDRVNNHQEYHKGHWQLSIGELNALPVREFSPDRFFNLNIELKDRPEKSGYVLICGQVPQDAQIEDVNYPEWVKSQIEYYESRGEKVLYRPHPRAGTEDFTLPKEQYLRGKLQPALDGAKFIVCYNSNVGHDALIQGVPVVCDPCAPYYELSGEECPPKDRRLRYFSRAAYGQWKLSELEQGLTETFNRMGYTL